MYSAQSAVKSRALTHCTFFFVPFKKAKAVKRYAKEIAARLRERYPGVPVRIDQANPAIGSHLGPGAIGIAALSAD